MFSGIVETKGLVKSVTVDGAIYTFCIEAPLIAESSQVSESIAVNGCCLTIVEKKSSVLSFQAVPETISRTNLGLLKEGSEVNLERALAVNARLGGHFVSGHVDGMAELIKIVEHENQCADYYFHISEMLAKNMVSKGSVTIDGVSLTLVNCERDSFSVSLIPFTLSETTLGTLRVGDRVNIETDILSKYVCRLLESQKSN